MNLTFKGFLKLYCQELAGEKTLNYRRLVALANGDAPRVAEPLLLLALEEGKEDYLRNLVHGMRMSHEYEEVCDVVGRHRGALVEALEEGVLPRRYQNVWKAFLAKKYAVEADRRVIQLMRDKVLEAMDAGGITVYGLCKALGLNKGNVYAYLNGGDATKVSRLTARRIYEYVSGVG